MFWADLIHVSPHSFKDVLLVIVKLSKDPKLGKVVKTFVNNMKLLPIQLVKDDDDHQQVSWRDLSEEKVKLHDHILPFNQNSDHIWQDFEGKERNDIGAYVAPVKCIAKKEFLLELKKFPGIWNCTLFENEIMG